MFIKLSLSVVIMIPKNQRVTGNIKISGLYLGSTGLVYLGIINWSSTGVSGIDASGLFSIKSSGLRSDRLVGSM